MLWDKLPWYDLIIWMFDTFLENITKMQNVPCVVPMFTLLLPPPSTRNSSFHLCIPQSSLCFSIFSLKILVGGPAPWGSSSVWTALGSTVTFLTSVRWSRWTFHTGRTMSFRWDLRLSTLVGRLEWCWWPFKSHLKASFTSLVWHTCWVIKYNT